MKVTKTVLHCSLAWFSKNIARKKISPPLLTTDARRPISLELWQIRKSDSHLFYRQFDGLSFEPSRFTIRSQFFVITGKNTKCAQIIQDGGDCLPAIDGDFLYSNQQAFVNTSTNFQKYTIYFRYSPKLCFHWLGYLKFFDFTQTF